VRKGVRIKTGLMY